MPARVLSAEPCWRVSLRLETVHGMTQRGRLVAVNLVLEPLSLFKCAARQHKDIAPLCTQGCSNRDMLSKQASFDRSASQTRLIHVLAGPSMTIRSFDAQAQAKLHGIVLTLYASETQTRQLLGQWTADGSIAAR